MDTEYVRGVTGTMSVMICRTCSQLSAAVDTILNERTTGKLGSREEWFMCPTCGYIVVSINDLSLSAPTLPQKLELESETFARYGEGNSHSSAHP